MILALVLHNAWNPAVRAADYQTTVLQDQPVGYWRLGETGGTTITNLGSLGSAANGETLDTPVTFGLPGAIKGDANTSAGFDGSSAKIEVPYNEVLNPTNYTIEVWANVAPDSSGVHRSPLASRDDTPSGNTAGYILYAEPGDTWQFWNGRAASWDALAGTSLTAGEWTHLVGTYDGRDKVFYVNGVIVAADQINFVPNRARVLRIGASANENPVGQFFFNGQLDEPAVYNRVLSADRILAHYRAGSGAEPAPVTPAIVVDLQATNLFKGDALVLTPLVTGSLPLTYQWKLNNTDIAGATNSSLSFTNIQPAANGNYTVTIKNSADAVTSAEAAVTVADIGKPVITQQPVSRTVVSGANVTFSVTASGSSTFNYQWKFKGAGIPNATNSTLQITNVQSANTGSYVVVVSNAAGSVTSDEAVLQLPSPATKSYADTVKEDGPVSYWRLDETSGEVATDSVGGNNGEYLNGVSLGVPGFQGQTNAAAQFSAESQQKVDVPFSATLNTPEFTVELWAKVTGGSGYRSPLTSRADAPQRGYIFYAEPGDTWQFWSGKGDTSGWDTIPGPAVETNTWTHLVGVYDGTNKTFYVNGAAAGSKPVVFGPNDEAVLRIGGGATESDGNYFFEGAVDDVAFYNKALAESRILAHYVAGASQTTSPSLSVTYNSGKITLVWSSGVLQSSDEITGQWTDVASAASPFSVTPAGTHRFYKVK